MGSVAEFRLWPRNNKTKYNLIWILIWISKIGNIFVIRHNCSSKCNWCKYGKAFDTSHIYSALWNLCYQSMAQNLFLSFIFVLSSNCFRRSFFLIDKKNSCLWVRINSGQEQIAHNRPHELTASLSKCHLDVENNDNKIECYESDVAKILFESWLNFHMARSDIRL